jgi:ZIP family zinc transporter
MGPTPRSDTVINIGSLVNNVTEVIDGDRRVAGVPASMLGGGAAAVLLALSALAVWAELWKLLGIVWFAFSGMAGGAALGARAAGGVHPTRLVWGYGLASGAMLTSALVFLVPSAVGHHAEFGGFGIAAGFLAGFAAHTVGHRLTHDLPFDHTGLELTAHALAAGVVIGVVYGNMPALGPVLGLAIVSHKGPAGYAAARRLVDADQPWTPLLVPAAGVGVTAIPAALVALPSGALLNAVVFGFAAGVFLHVAVDFLPRCELGGQVYEVAQLSSDAHGLLDELRVHAVASTTLGGVVVFLAWLLVGG